MIDLTTIRNRSSASMPNESRIHRRRNLRLVGWDYSADDAYFVTLCCVDRSPLFGDIVEGEMRLNAFGELVANTWQWLPAQYPYVILDEWCVMPDHLHGILVLAGRRGSRTAPARHGMICTPMRKPVGRLIGAFKTVSTKRINQIRKTPRAIVWQRDFWDHIVRDETEMERIRGYVRTNAAD